MFAYLPLYGWSYAFFNYRAGLKLLDCEFVGFKYFNNLIANPVLRGEVFRVLQNTFGISLLNILVSPLPMIFAIFLMEMRSNKFKRTIQTLTTLPNFISWILVYSVAWSIFSVGDGFLNRLLIKMGAIDAEINFLASKKNVWLTMVGYTQWKTLGWSAIMYIAALTGINQEQYEAAIVDGANRFQKIWYITVPGLLPTYFVLLILSIANFLNNGLEQYFVFENAFNKSKIEVLDLFVYNQGMVGQNIPFATAVSMLKSVVSIGLLFVANGLSKLVRGQSII